MSTAAPSGRASWLGEGRSSVRMASEEDPVGDGLAVGALQRELRALLVLLGQRLEDAQRVADDLGIGGGLGLLLEAGQPLHGLGRHLELHAGGGALAVGGVLAAAVMGPVMMMTAHVLVLLVLVLARIGAPLGEMPM